MQSNKIDILFKKFANLYKNYIYINYFLRVIR